MTLDEALKEIKILKLELELAQACHNEKCAEFNKLCFDYAKLQVKNEKFEQNMKNVLDIEKKNTVKEFAQKITDSVADYLYKTNFDGHKENIVDMFELCEIVDSAVKEYENDISKS